MASGYKFPIELFHENFKHVSTNLTAGPQMLAQEYLDYAASGHWSASLIRQKIRYQIKTFDLIKKALQKKDYLTIQKWYVAGLHNDLRYFSGNELDLMEQIVKSAQNNCINPLLDFERGNSR